MVDKNAEAILDNLPRSLDSIPKIPLNAVVFIDVSGRLNIMTAHGALTIDEEDLNVLDAEGFFP